MTVWQDLAACAGRTDLFFSDDPDDQTAAQAFCAGCPVAAPCLASALLKDEQDGVWAGFSTVERHTLIVGLRQGRHHVKQRVSLAAGHAQLVADPTDITLMSPTEVCVLLRVSRVTLWRWATAGQLVPIRLSARANRYHRADIVAFLERRHGTGRDHIVDAALELLAEQQAEEQRPLCPTCGVRRVNLGASQCTQCVHRHEDAVARKKRWWDAHGSALRSEAQRQAREEAQ